MMVVSVFLLGLWLIAAVISLLGTAFWLWMLVDCVINEPSHGNDKLVWILLIVLLPFLGSVLYYFVRRPNRPVLAQAIHK
jgi:hypothetical protein